MASTNKVNTELYQELRRKYPDLTEFIIRTHIIKNKNNREKCIQVLDGEAQSQVVENHISTIHISDVTNKTGDSQRQRSDSASSGMSNTSSCSVSSTASQNAGRGTPLLHPSGDAFMHFVPSSNQNIPNINCEAPQIPQRKDNTPTRPFMKEIVVNHSPMENSQLTIQLNTSRQNSTGMIGNSSDSNHQIYNQQFSYPGNTSSRQQIVSPGHIFSQYPSNSARDNFTPPYMAPGAGQFPHSYQYNNAGSQPGKIVVGPSYMPNQLPNTCNNPIVHQHPQNQQQHSSEAKIFISGAGGYPNSSSVHTYVPNPGMQAVSCSDGSMNSQPLSCYDSNVTIPLTVNTDLQPDHPPALPIRQPPISSATNFSGMSSVNFNPRHAIVLPGVNTNQAGEGMSFCGAVNPPSMYRPGLYSPDNSDLRGCHVGYSHYVPALSSSSVTPPVPVRIPSVDPDNMSSYNMHIPVLPSPASSQSSHSSESSSHHGQRPRSGSMQEEAAYTQALLAFQKERMNTLKNDLESELRKLAKTREEVNHFEKNMLDRQQNRNMNNFNIEDIAKLRDYNLKLQAEIQVMTREIDMYNSGQTPVGVVDPMEAQSFFRNMNTGQSGNIFASQEEPPPIPRRLVKPNTVPPAAVAQPQTNSGDSDGDGEQWSCSACTLLNHPALDKCEMCEMPRSRNTGLTSTTGYTPTLSMHGT